MILYVCDKALNLHGIVEKIISLVWRDRKYSYGNFSMLLPATQENIRQLQRGMLIFRDDEEKIPAEILYIHFKKGASGGHEMEVSGKCLTSWLAGRLVLPSFASASLSPLSVMRRAVDENAINTLPDRKIPLMHLGSVSEDRNSGLIDFACEENTTVLSMCEKLAEAKDLGFAITADLEQKKFQFDVYTGRNRTMSGSNPCVFSLEFENILEQELIQSTENLKTVGYVMGETEETFFSVGTASGHERLEMFINGTSIKKSYSENDQKIELTDEQYRAKLTEFAENELIKNGELNNFYTRINGEAQGCKYGIDYKLGDMVTCMNRDWAVSVDVPVTEVEMTYEAGIKQIYVTFGTALPVFRI